MSDIFISYASEDRPRIRPLVDALQKQGWSVWWDRTILAGKSFDDVIEAALADARCVIVLWSRHSIVSRWVRTEAEEADRRGILVPALLDQVTIPFAFRRIQAANLTEWQGRLPNAEFDQLVHAVSSVLSSAAPPPAQAAATPRPEEVTKREKKTPISVLLRSHRAPVLIGVLACVCIIAIGAYLLLTHRPAPPNTSTGEKPSIVEHRAPELRAAPPLSTSSAEKTPAAPIVQPLRAGEVRENPQDNLKYVWIPPGKFMMGCSPGDSECRDNEKPAHQVNITRGFWIGQAPVTQAAYERVTKTNPSHFHGSDLPVETVSWDEAKAYCEAVGMRLPTEAEWEYAARARSKEARYGPIDQIAWYSGNSNGQTHPVAGKAANAWGLYDMLGNVWEWCSDWFGEYQSGAAENPTGPENGEYRLLRGGSWADIPRDARVSVRGKFAPSFRDVSVVGFRCAGELP